MSSAFCVIVEHQQGPDWALVLTASRVGERRHFTPFIFAFGTDGLFATCPNADAWAHHGKLRLFSAHGRTPAIREELLRNAVADVVKHCHNAGTVLEHTRVGFVKGLRAAPYVNALPNFKSALDNEPAFEWLYESKGSDSDYAVQALCICKYLAAKHGLDKLSLAELEAAGTRRILKGY